MKTKTAATTTKRMKFFLSFEKAETFAALVDGKMSAIHTDAGWGILVRF